MATQLNKQEREVFKNLQSSEPFQKVLKWWCDTAPLSGKTASQQKKETIEQLRQCAKIIVRNPNIKVSRIFGWWFALDGYRKPRNIILC